MPEYLTTSEVADLLRIKERKVYDLAATGDMPCSKAIGKLLFPREQLVAWIAQNSENTITQPSTSLATTPNVLLGSHDPLLEWAIRESQSGLATLLDGSQDGLRRFNNNEGVIVGIHLHNHESDSWNVDAVKKECGQAPAVVMEWAKRQRGFILANGMLANVNSIHDIAKLSLIPRQEDAGAQKLLLALLNENDIDASTLSFCAAARTETDIATAIRAGTAQAGFGLATIAKSHQLDFFPVLEERFDLLINRKQYFERAVQKLLRLTKTDLFKERANTLGGYNVEQLGTIHYNASN